MRKSRSSHSISFAALTDRGQETFMKLFVGLIRWQLQCIEAKTKTNDTNERPSGFESTNARVFLDGTTYLLKNKVKEMNFTNPLDDEKCDLMTSFAFLY